MAVQYLGSTGTSGPIASMELAIPSEWGVQEGDLLVYGLRLSSAQAPGVPSGWTRFRSDGADSTSMDSYYLVVGESVPASVTFTQSADQLATYILSAWRGAMPLGSYARITSGANESVIDLPELAGVTVSADEFYVCHWHASSQSGFSENVVTRLSVGNQFTYLGRLLTVTPYDLSDAGVDDPVANGVQGFRADAFALGELAPPAPGEPGGPSSQSPLDRYRSSISADAGSLLATTRAVPFDTSHSIAFSPAAELDQDALYPFHEATSEQSGAADVMFYPRARQSIDGPIVYDGVTILTLMERVFPAQILTRTSSVSLGDSATAQAIITYVFQQWAAAYPWFTYKAVPDLRLRSTTVTGDWDSVLALRTTVLRDSVIRVRQDPNSPRSMLAMLEGLLSPFQGTQYFMDSDGDLVIRPVYGPDADAAPYKTLDEGDVRTISIGEPSVGQIRNRATGSFQRYTEADDVSVLTPAFLQVASWYLRDPAFLPGPPVSDYLEDPTVTHPGRLDVSTDDAGFGGWRTIPLGEGVVIGDDPIAFEDTGGVLITAAVNTYNSAGTLQEAWTSPGDLTVQVHSTVPLDGSTVLAFTVWRSVGDTTNSYYGRWNARWNAAENALQLQWAGGGLEVNTFSTGTLRAAQMSITINGVARAWAEGATISAMFGVVDDGDFVPGPDGTNALAASVTNYGVVEERFTVEGYGALSVSQLERIVEAYVIENLTPRATRELALTWKGAVGLEFDDRGRLVGFPGDGEGFLVGRQYADDFLADAGGVVVKVEETVPASPGTIDLEAVYLLHESGALWLNENGTPSPPA